MDWIKGAKIVQSPNTKLEFRLDEINVSEILFHKKCGLIDGWVVGSTMHHGGGKDLPR